MLFERSHALAQLYVPVGAGTRVQYQAGGTLIAMIQATSGSRFEERFANTAVQIRPGHSDRTTDIPAVCSSTCSRPGNLHAAIGYRSPPGFGRRFRRPEKHAAWHDSRTGRQARSGCSQWLARTRNSGCRSGVQKSHANWAMSARYGVLAACDSQRPRLHPQSLCGPASQAALG